MKYPELAIEKCPCCNRDFGGIKTFEGFMARLLVQCVKISSSDFLAAKDIKNKSYYARIADLKYWNLLYQLPEWNHYGKYSVTRKAKDFLKGEIEIPVAAYVYNGECKKFSHETISFRKAMGKEFFEIEDWLNDWKNFTYQPDGQRSFL